MILNNADKAIITISKEKLADLPSANYTGRIQIIDKPEQVKTAIEEIRAARIIGFDTETRPSFKKGQRYRLALIQLCTPSCCYLFRVNKIGFPKELQDLIEDPHLLKVGLSLRDDFLNIQKVIEINPQGFIDLQNFVKEFKIVDNSLTRLYAILFGKRISKGQRLTNWEAPELTESQLNYAALDAFACITIYNYLKEGKFNPDTSEYLTTPSEQEESQEPEEE